MRHFRFLCVALCVAAAGCKKSSPAAPAATTSPGGIYEGVLTSSAQGATYSVVALVNQGGNLQLVNTSNSTQISGQLPVNVAASTSTITAFDAAGKPLTTGSLSVSVTPGSQITGTYVLGNGDSGRVILAYDSQYATPIDLATAAGSYQWTSTRNGGASTLTLSATGAVTGTTEYGCAFTGTAAVDSTSFDLFNLTLTAAGSTACGTAAGTTLTGLAYYAPLRGNTPTTLFSAATNPALGTFAKYQR